jgi:hypothetical protein
MTGYHEIRGALCRPLNKRNFSNCECERSSFTLAPQRMDWFFLMHEFLSEAFSAPPVTSLP